MSEMRPGNPAHPPSALARLANLLGAAAVGLGDILAEIGRRATGMEGSGAAALVVVGTRPGRPIDDLRRALGLSHSGAVRLVERLEGRGWVERGASVDRRRVPLVLTPSGRRLVDQILAERIEALSRLVEGLGQEERSALEHGIAMVLSALPGDQDDAWRICRLCDRSACGADACPVAGGSGGPYPPRGS